MTYAEAERGATVANVGVDEGERGVTRSPRCNRHTRRSLARAAGVHQAHWRPDRPRESSGVVDLDEAHLAATARLPTSISVTFSVRLIVIVVSCRICS
jgi:hypothetical protein